MLGVQQDTAGGMKTNVNTRNLKSIVKNVIIIFGSNACVIFGIHTFRLSHKWDLI